jgi:ubiquinone/menaquinone biosynthesis C-methylase UbiE
MSKDKIIQYYTSGIEKNRFALDYFALEGFRTKSIIKRYVRDKQHLKIADIGGGTGYYAHWLQEMGHEVTLVDLTPENIHLAKSISAEKNIKLREYLVGDATNLPLPAESFDLVLLMGPLYHLTESTDRVKAIKEAGNILKPGGTLLCAIISRYASVMDGLHRDLVMDPMFEKILHNDLDTGIHLNPTGEPDYFTTAYFHRPAELKTELITGGLEFDKLVAVEGLGYTISHISEKWKNDDYRKRLSTILTRLESNADVLACSPHIIGIAHKKNDTGL